MDLRRMKFGFGGGSGQIFDLLTQAGEAALAVSRAVERRFVEWPSGPTQEHVKQLEHEADRIVSELLSQTNSLFVTPYDRDDLITLAFAVDEVADAGENAAELLGLYSVETPTRKALELCELLVDASKELALLLGDMKGKGAAQRVIAIKEIEDRGDEIARAARASLFKDDRIDPVIVIRWKDIYEALEDAIDACETAAHRVGNILVKNA
jgi:predicted phosphate transport protein (TIGR00153 family)